MGIVELILLSIGLAMDAFAVSVCKGMAMKKMDWKKAVRIALYFGIFQAVMPVIGYGLGKGVEGLVSNIDHWIAFGLLSIIGIKMIKDSFAKESESCEEELTTKTMLGLAIATSIDALAVGITFSFLQVNLLVSIACIGIITGILSMVGTKAGNCFGDKLGNKAEIIGGIILILLGVKILLEHLNLI